MCAPVGFGLAGPLSDGHDSVFGRAALGAALV
jgi:hypothetical protein